MFKKLSIFFVLFFTISFVSLGLTYSYYIYYLKSPIEINIFQKVLNKNVIGFLEKNYKNYGLKIQIEKSSLEFKKIDEFLNIHLINLRIKNKENNLNTILDKVTFVYSFRDIFINLFDFLVNKKISFQKLRINSLHLSGKLNKNSFVPGPILFLLSDQTTRENFNNQQIKLDYKSFEIKKINFTLDDNIGIFKGRKLIILCQNLNSIYQKNFVNSISLSCNHESLINFDFRLNQESDRVIIKGKINSLDTRIFDSKLLKMNKFIDAKIFADYKLILDENFYLKKINLNLLDNTSFKFDGLEKINTLTGNINWDLNKNLFSLNQLVINKNNFVNGKIFRSNKKFFSKLNLKFSEIKQNFITLFDKKFDVINKVKIKKSQLKKIKNILKNSKNQKFNNIQIDISTIYDSVYDKITINKLNSEGSFSLIRISNLVPYTKNFKADFFGKFNYRINNFNNPDLIVKGYFKNAEFNFNEGKRKYFFTKVELKSHIKSELFILDKLNCYNYNSNFSITGEFWEKKSGFDVGKLNLNIIHMETDFAKDLINVFKEDKKVFTKLEFNGGKIFDSNLLLKFKNQKGHNLEKRILSGKFKFKNIFSRLSDSQNKIFFNNLILNYDNKTKFFGNAEGRMNNMPFKANFNFDKSYQIKSFGYFYPPESFQKDILNKTRIEISSLSKIQFNMNGDLETGLFNANLYGDLTSTKIKFDYLNIDKKIGEKANFNSTLVFTKRKLKNIKNFHINFAEKHLKADIYLVEKNVIKIKNLISKNFNLKKIIIKKIENKISISANGDYLDLGYFRKNKVKNQISEDIEVDYDFLAKKILLDDKLSISGNYRGKIKDKVISSIAIGKMNFGSNPILDEGELKIHVTDSASTLTGNGLMGGAETFVKILSLKNKLPKIIFNTQDGGKLLSALKFTNKIRSGAMKLDISFSNKKLDQYFGMIKGKNFSVLEAPTIIKSLSSLGFSGINSLFVGQGVAFQEGVAKFRKDDEEMIFEKILINNDTLSIFLSGKYNLRNNSINFTGSIAPIRLLSKFLSVVPAVGELLTGLKKDGIFAGQFKIDGTLDNFEIDINELSFAPGILRDIFSRDWIKDNSLEINKK